jgi:hypothetical protein
MATFLVVALSSCDDSKRTATVSTYFHALRNGTGASLEQRALLVPAAEMDEARAYVRAGHGDRIEAVAGVRTKECLDVHVTGATERDVWLVFYPDDPAPIAGMSLTRKCSCHGRHATDRCDFEH